MFPPKTRVFQGLVVAIIILQSALSPVEAKDRYTVEILVFKSTNSANEIVLSSNEIWKEDSENALSDIISPNKRSEKNQKNLKRNPVTFNSGKKLGYYLNRLKKNPSYEVLKYVSWNQRLQSKKLSPKVPFSQQLTKENNSNNTQSPNLEGFVKFYLGSFLQLDVNLTYSPPSSLIPPLTTDPTNTLDSSNGALDSIEKSPSSAPLRKYTIREKRRVKIDRFNYFDHPNFGVIAVVYPTKKKTTK